MGMNKSMFVLAVVVLGVTMSCGGSSTEAPAVVEEVVEVAPAVEEVVVARNDVIFTCSCGPDCECGAAAMTAGKCECGTDLVAGHLVKVEGNEALVCTCEEGCICEINAEDETKCGCGKDVKRVNLEGKGLYYCNCGGSCTCNHVSAEPGKCGCGMDLVTS
jgi:hypothetical protein